MTRRTWRERSDWKRRMRVKFEVEELGRSEEEPQTERDDWNKVGLGGETWEQRGGNWRGDRRGGKMSLREKNGKELDQVEVALIPIVELHVPDEFGVGGHIVVSDHAAVPPAAELHADVSSDEMARVRGGRGYLR
jgi:hypothetical protein